VCAAVVVSLACQQESASAPADAEVVSSAASESPLFAEASASSAPQKRALVVAIGSYPKPAVYGYATLQGPKNDIGLMRTAFRSQDFDDIVVLQDEEATREGILEALNAAVKTTNPGDVFVLHYAGHGDQITDDNGDEIDGYDEVLVPYGAPGNAFFKTKQERGAYTGTDHIRDDELHGYLLRLRQRAGADGNVVFWLDSCHSGTGARGPGDGPQPRGGRNPIGPPAETRRASSDQEDGVFETVDEQAQARGDGDSLAPFVVISGSRQGELNYETEDENGQVVGSLSFTLSQALSTAKPGDTYDMLFDEVARLMDEKAPHQSPQIEGDIFTEVFSGRAVAQRPYYDVERVQEEGTIVIAGGTLTGLFEGSGVALYPRQTTTTAGADGEPLATGTVTNSDWTAAIVELDSVGAEEDDLLESRAFVTEQAYGDMVIEVQLGEDLETGVRDALRPSLEDTPVVQLVEQGGDFILEHTVSTSYKGSLPDARPVFVVSAIDSLPVAPPVSAGSPGLDIQVIERLKDVARNQYLKRIDTPREAASEIDLRLEMIPATHHVDEFGRVDTSYTNKYAGQPPGGTWEFRPDEDRRDGVDGYLIRVRNVGEKPAYATVLDLLPNSRATQILPLDGFVSREETYIAPDDTVLFRGLPLAVEPIYGKETLKLIATREPIDLRPILNRVAQARSKSGERKSRGPFQQLFAEVHSGTKRGPVGAPRGAFSTHSVSFHVVPRE
jgi:hypothetical protein